jgi:hypothetical protein
MRPPRCAVCSKRAVDETGLHRGDWLTFSDYPSDEAEHGLSTPGIAYFCAEHVSAARLLDKLTADEAIAELHVNYASDVDKHVLVPKIKKKWWQRFL